MKVFVTTNAYHPLRVYHTDQECRVLQREDVSFREVDRDVLYDELNECKYCTGEFTPPGGFPAHNETTCGTCKATIEPGEACEFCETFDEVMGLAD